MPAVSAVHRSASTSHFLGRVQVLSPQYASILRTKTVVELGILGSGTGFWMATMINAQPT